jgi:tetratricopeptide (TPR) repeat protein
LFDFQEVIIMRSVWTLLLVLLLASPASVVRADSTTAQIQSAKLDILFGKLHDPTIGSAAPHVELQIWTVWMRGGSDAENELLRRATVAMYVAQFIKAEAILNVLIAKTKTFPEAYNKRATLYFAMGRYDEALADIEIALELEPRHFGAMVGRGLIYQKLGRDGDALAAYREALSMNPHLVGTVTLVKELEKKTPAL